MALTHIPDEEMTYGIVFELSKECSNLYATVSMLWPDKISQSDFQKKMKSAKKTLKTKHQKQRGMKDLFDKPFLQELHPTKRDEVPVPPRETVCPKETPSAKKPSVSTWDYERLKDKEVAIKELYDSKCAEVTDLESKLYKLEDEVLKQNTCIEQLQNDMDVTEMKLKDVSAELIDIKSSAKYRRVLRRKQYLNKKEKVMSQKLEMCNEDEMSRLKAEIRSIKIKACKLKKKLRMVREEKITLTKELVKVKSECAELQGELLVKDSEGLETKLHSRGQPYTEAVEKCVMELVGELDVPTSKCSAVIETVSRWLFNKDISKEDLPSASTATNIVDRAHVLSKYQVAESMVTSEKWDLHGDGTSRDHKKIVGQQITLDSGKTLSTGFSQVAVEDSTTLLDNAIAMMEELSSIYDETNQEQVFKDILGKMFAVMSDRSSVNKKMNDKLNEYRQSTLGENTPDLHFLFCNAHFLLGLSNGAEGVLKKQTKILEEQLGHPIGRDNSDRFKSFKSAGESGPARFVRTACDVLGPRGDEKNGCKSDWDAYCAKSDVKSNVTSFRMNRFNNFFQGAAGLFFHRNHIIDFFDNFKDNRNLKLESVFLDALSPELQALVRALGLIYYKVTGPFWNMLHSGVEYVDQYLYVQEMLKCFKELAVDSSLLLQEDFHIFPEFSVKADIVANCIFSPDHSHEDLTKDILQAIMAEYVTVTERQLLDFLPGGIYGEEPCAERRQSMKHCKLTNLVSEYEFGDLDFSQFRRRHASLYFHSGIQMVKRNKTISSWLSSKPPHVQTDLLQTARNKSFELRKKHKQAEREVSRKLQERLEESNRLKVEKEARKLETKRALIESVRLHGGPCITPEDVDRLLVGKKISQQKELLKNEMRYLKIVLGLKDKRLVFGSKGVCELQQCLQDLLMVPRANGENQLENDSADVVLGELDSADVVLGEPLESKKRKWSETLGSRKKKKLTNTACFGFKTQGVWVAVAYEGDFFVGSVINVSNSNVATVQFLMRGAKSSFKWPPVDDVAEVESKFVFAHDFDVTSENGRMWQVPDLEYIEELYNQYVKIYF